MQKTVRTLHAHDTSTFKRAGNYRRRAEIFSGFHVPVRNICMYCAKNTRCTENTTKNIAKHTKTWYITPMY